MNPAIFDQTTVDIDAKPKTGDTVYRFRVTGSVLKFEGFLKVYEESKDSKDEEDEALKHKLPLLVEGQKLTLKGLNPEQHFTEPPPRFNEASLVKELEERGIGRPSTYSAIISTIQERQYVQKVGGKFIPTEIGLVVTDLLVANFKDIFDPQYTARLEEELDEIEEGKETWTDALKGFYKKFEKELHYAEKHMENVKRMEKPTDEKCERCGSPLVIKWGKHGSFYACSAYDKTDPNSCTFTKENPIDLPDLDSADVQETTQEEYCENCGRADGAEARPLRTVHGLHRISGLQDHAPARSGQEGPRHSVGREVSAVRAESPAASRPLRRVHLVQRLSRLQVGEAELHWREVSGVQDRRPGGEEGAPWQSVLRLLELSQVQVHLGLQAGRRGLSGVRQPVSAGEEPEVGNLHGLSEQQAD